MLEEDKLFRQNKTDADGHRLGEQITRESLRKIFNADTISRSPLLKDLDDNGVLSFFERFANTNRVRTQMLLAGPESSKLVEIEPESAISGTLLNALEYAAVLDSNQKKDLERLGRVLFEQFGDHLSAGFEADVEKYGTNADMVKQYGGLINNLAKYATQAEIYKERYEATDDERYHTASDEAMEKLIELTYTNENVIKELEGRGIIFSKNDAATG